MTIVDLNLTSDALAFKMEDASKKMISELEDVAHEKLYLVGNAADFEEFCVPAIKYANPVGAACIWPKVTRSRVFEGFDIAIVRDFVQPVPDNADVVVLQAVASTAEEIVSMITKVLQRTRPSRIRLLSCITAQDLETSLKPYLDRLYDADFKVVARDHFDPKIDAFDFQQRAYDLLDNRPCKDFPNMPEWVLGQMKGRGPDPEPSLPPAPSAPSLGTLARDTPIDDTLDEFSEYASDGSLEQTEENAGGSYKFRSPFD